MIDLLRRYENGLDTAGVSESQWFADWANDLAAGRCDVETVLLAVFDRFGERNGNREVAAEFLAAFADRIATEAAREAPEYVWGYVDETLKTHIECCTRSACKFSSAGCVAHAREMILGEIRALPPAAPDSRVTPLELTTGPRPIVVTPGAVCTTCDLPKGERGPFTVIFSRDEEGDWWAELLGESRWHLTAHGDTWAQAADRLADFVAESLEDDAARRGEGGA